MNSRRLALCAASLMASAGSAASAAIISSLTPGELDTLMGTPLFVVPGDGMPVGTMYGHPPSFTPGIPLATPIGDMGFGPSHERLTLGTPGSSGSFLALTALTGPIAGSTLHAPAGTSAIDFFIGPAPAGPLHSFEITAIGTSSSLAIVVPASPTPVYVGFGAFGESIEAVSIVKLPFPSPTSMTWVVGDLRVLPSPGTMVILSAGGLFALRRRRA